MASKTASEDRPTVDGATGIARPPSTAASRPAAPQQELPAATYPEDSEGPPIPPWRKPKLAGPESNAEVGTGAVVPASFDPFGGTPFQETLGLNPADSVAPAKSPSPDERGEDFIPAESQVPAETQADAAPKTGPRFTEAADPTNDAWQPPPPPPSTWKSRN
jgi:hypothetical protein